MPKDFWISIRKASAYHKLFETPRLLGLSKGADFERTESLNVHREQVHNCCVHCNLNFATPTDLTNHDISAHYFCVDCSEYFNLLQNLKTVCGTSPRREILFNNEQHSRTHRMKTVNCYGCPKKFDAVSSMMLHLESGCCSSNTCKEEVDDLAEECYQAHRYTSDDPEYPFECTDCEATFPAMSALLQHVESETCSAESSPGSPLGKFLKFLRSRI